MASLATSADELQAVKYAKVAGLALLLFDYCITLPSEVKWTWGRRWDITQIVFLLSRYLPFVASTLATYPYLVDDHHDCFARGWATHIIFSLSIVSSDGLLLMRAYAFWLRNKLVLAFLLITAIIFVGVAEGLIVHLNTTLDTAISSCIDMTGRASAIQYGFLVAYEIIILFLMIFKKQTYHNTARSSLVQALVTGAIKYVCVLCVASATNILVLVFAPPSYSELMFNVQLALHSAMSSRILFDLHETQEKRSLTALELTRLPKSEIVVHVEQSSYVTGPDGVKHPYDRYSRIPSSV